MNDAGAESFWTGGAPTDDNNSAGINAWNCSRLDILSNHVSDTMANGTGQNYGIYVQQKSAGAVATAFNTESVNVTGNSIVWASGLAGNGVGYKGVVFDCTLGTDVNPTTYSLVGLSVSQNSVRRTRNTGIEVLVGADCNVSNAQVNQNNTDSTCQAGTAKTGALAVGVYDGVAGNSAMFQHVAVCQNQIRASVTYGIYLPALHLGEFSDVRVTDNTLADTVLSGVYLEADPGTAPVTIKQISIDQNQIIGFATGGGTHHGVHIEDVSGKVGTLAKISISKNRLESGVASGTTLGSGIRVEAKDVSLWELTCSDNTIQNPSSMDGVTHFGGMGINISTAPIASVLGTSVFGLEVSRNSVWTEVDPAFRLAVQGIVSGMHVDQNTFGTDVGVGEPMRITLDSFAVFAADVYNSGLQITGNQCFGGVGSTFRITGSTKLASLSVRGNTFTDSTTRGLAFAIYDTYALGNAAVKNLSISDNTFRGITDEALRLDLGVGGAAASASMNNVSVTGNKFYECGTTGGGLATVVVETIAVVVGHKICDNEFYNCGGTTDTASAGTVQCMFGSTGGTSVTSAMFNNNLFADCGGCAILIADRAAGNSVWTIRGLTVSGNQIRNQTNDAISIGLAAYSSASQITVCDNVVDTVLGAASDMGITVRGPNATDTLSEIVVSHNSIRNTGDGAGVCPGSIYMYIPRSVSNMQLDGNMVTGSGANCAAQVYVFLGGSWTGGSVSSNVLSNNAGSHGVSVHCAASIAGVTGLLNVAVCGNTITAPGGAGISIYGADNTSTPMYHSLTVDGNTIKGAGGSGIYVAAFTGTAVQGLSVSKNMIYNAGVTGIVFEFGGATDFQGLEFVGNTVNTTVAGAGISVQDNSVTTNVISGLNISGNNLTDLYTYGIFVGKIVGGGTRSFHDLVVSGNTVKSWSNDVGLDYYGGFHIHCEDILSFTLANNVMFGAQTRAIGYYLETNGTSNAVAITGNVASLQDALTSESMRCVSGAANQRGYTITGNSFRGAAIGVNVAASSFAPQHSTVAYNSEKTTGAAAGNWSVFVGVFTNSIVVNPAVGAAINQD